MADANEAVLIHKIMTIFRCSILLIDKTPLPVAFPYALIIHVGIVLCLPGVVIEYLINPWDVADSDDAE